MNKIDKILLHVFYLNISYFILFNINDINKYRKKDYLYDSFLQNTI